MGSGGGGFTPWIAPRRRVFVRPRDRSATFGVDDGRPRQPVGTSQPTAYPANAARSRSSIPTPPMPARLVPFAVALRAPLVLAQGRIAERRGWLLRVVDDDGRVGWGECAPFPGLSPETLAEAEASLRAWVAAPSERTEASLTPSARAAVAGARLDLAAQAAGVSMAQILDRSAAAAVDIAALLAGDDEAVVAKAGAVARAGVRAAKLKVGAASVADDARRVRAVADALGSGVALRLDANRAWSFDDASRFADAVAGIAIAYVEEPLADVGAGGSHLAAWTRATGLPVALDESVIEIATPDALADHAYAAAIVLKPLVVGGVRAALDWGRAARRLGMAAVVSGAFETGVGTRHTLALAAALGARGASAAGLDPYTFLATDVLAPRLSLDAASVDVEAALGPGHRVTMEGKARGDEA